LPNEALQSPLTATYVEIFWLRSSKQCLSYLHKFVDGPILSNPLVDILSYLFRTTFLTY
jgi:hypothetical protein